MPSTATEEAVPKPITGNQWTPSDRKTSKKIMSDGNPCKNYENRGKHNEPQLKERLTNNAPTACSKKGFEEKSKKPLLRGSLERNNYTEREKKEYQDKKTINNKNDHIILGAGDYSRKNIAVTKQNSDKTGEQHKYKVSKKADVNIPEYNQKKGVQCSQQNKNHSSHRLNSEKKHHAFSNPLPTDSLYRNNKIGKTKRNKNDEAITIKTVESSKNLKKHEEGGNAIMQSSLITYVAENIFVKENLKNATDVYKHQGGNIQNEKLKVISDIEIFECQGTERENVTKYKEHFDSMGNSSNVEEGSSFTKRKQTKCNYYEEGNNQMKDTKQMENLGVDRLNKLTLASDIYENSVGETTQKYVSVKRSRKSIHQTRHVIVGDKKSKKSLRSLSESCLKLRRNKFKNHINSRKCKIKPTLYNMVDNLLNANSLKDISSKSSKTWVLTKQISKVFGNKNLCKYNSRRHCDSINKQPRAFTNSPSNGTTIDPEVLTKDGKQFKHDKLVYNNFDDNIFKDPDLNKKANSPCTKDNLNQLKKSFDENQFCFADPQFYYTDSEPSSDEQELTSTDVNNTKTLSYKEDDNESTYDMPYHKAIEISNSVSQSSFKVQSIEEVIYEISEPINAKKKASAEILIKTIQTEYENGKCQGHHNVENNFLFKGTDRPHANDKDCTSYPPTRGHLTISKVPHQSTVTLISAFGSRSHNNLPTDSEKTIERLAGSSNYADISSSMMKDISVTAPNSDEIKTKIKSNVDKGVMCFNGKKHKHHKHRKSKHYLQRESEEMRYQEAGYNEDSSMLCKSQDKFNGNKEGFKQNTNKNSNDHMTAKSNDTDFINIKLHKLPHHKPVSKQKSPKEFPGKRCGTFIKKEELDEAKIKFKDNFKFVISDENIGAGQPKGIWNSFINSGHQMFMYLRPSGTFKSCFGRNIFR